MPVDIRGVVNTPLPPFKGLTVYFLFTHPRVFILFMPPLACNPIPHDKDTVIDHHQKEMELQQSLQQTPATGCSGRQLPHAKHP